MQHLSDSSFSPVKLIFHARVSAKCQDLKPERGPRSFRALVTKLLAFLAYFRLVHPPIPICLYRDIGHERERNVMTLSPYSSQSWSLSDRGVVAILPLEFYRRIQFCMRDDAQTTFDAVIDTFYTRTHAYAHIYVKYTVNHKSFAYYFNKEIDPT